MAEKMMSVSQQQTKPIKILKWKVSTGNTVSIGRVILLYDFDGASKDQQRKLKVTQAGTVHRILAQEGAIVQPGEVLCELRQCTHPTVMNDMCGECGTDLRKNDVSFTASVQMVHAIPNLKVSQELALKLGRADTERLIRDRKLALLVDLDQTLIHTTNDAMQSNIKDVYHFQLYGPNSPWYHTRLRPGTHEFLSNIYPLFELHICTFGARNYAHMIAAFLDRDQKFFSNRILSRDECFDPTSKRANLKALFPCGDDLVCIIDDREDVWSNASNLIHVKPYHFFQHTGDINAPPGLDKYENDNKAGVDLSKFKDLKKVEHCTEKDANINSETGDGNENKDGANNENEENDRKKKTNTETDNNGEYKAEDVSNEGNKIENDRITEMTAENDKKAIELGSDNKPVVKSENDNKPGLKFENDNKPEVENDTNSGDKTGVKTDNDTNDDKSVKIAHDTNNDNKSVVKIETDHRPEDKIEKDKAEDKAENDDKPAVKIESDKKPEIILCDRKESSVNGATENGHDKPDENSEEEKCGKAEDAQPEILTNSENATNKIVEQQAANQESNLIEVDDPDDYLLHLEDILKRIHREFYEDYDKMESGEVPDLKQVIPRVRGQVLKGCKLVFSGLVPTHVKLQQSKAYQIARGLGAEVTQELEEDTTHLVAVRPGTAKVSAGRRKKNLKIVTSDWLWSCAERWEHADEKLFALNSKGSKNRRPPPHCTSPEHIVSYPEHNTPAMRKRTPSGRFMDTINPLMSFSSADIADMDKEVEDILDDESDSSDEEMPQKEAEAQVGKVEDNSSSSSEDSLTAENPKGYKRKRDENEDVPNGEDDDPPSVKFKRGEMIDSELDVEQDSQDSDGSVEAPDEADDGEWNMMGAALEREFLSNN